MNGSARNTLRGLAAAALCAFTAAHADPLLLQELHAAGAAKSDLLGTAAAASGDTLVVGADADDVIDTNQGTATVFVRSGDNWIQQAQLFAADGGVQDNFGYKVAISGDTIVVGAQGNDVGANEDQGAAYVFVRNGTHWSQQARLDAVDGIEGELFGRSVAVSGDLVAVGAPFEDVDTKPSQGVVYVFHRTGTEWLLEARLTPSDGAAQDRFGEAVAIQGQTLVVGAPTDPIFSAPNRQSAQVFGRSASGTWSRISRLTVQTSPSHANYGETVAISGDAVAVGAEEQKVGAHFEQGAVYVYRRSLFTPGYFLEATLTANDGDTADRFGGSLAFDGGVLVAGAPGDDVDGKQDLASAYVFLRSGDGLFGSGTWSRYAKLTPPDGAAFDDFGESVAVSNDAIFVGSTFHDAPGAEDAGAVYAWRVPFDYGDAPAPFPSLRTEGGARHVVTALTLGAANDFESDASINSGSTGDDIAGIDDEDGAQFLTDLATGSTALMRVDVRGGTGKVDAWVDFNGDGDWFDDGERIADHVAMTAGVHTVGFKVPEGARLGSVQVRVRLSTAGSAFPSGMAVDGEVEDFTATIRNRTLSINDVRKAEGTASRKGGPTTTPFVFTVALSETSRNPVSVDYAVTPPRGTTSDDFVAAHGTLNIPANASTGTITVLVDADAVSEPDQRFVVTLGKPVGASIADGQGTGTIVDDD